MAIATTAKRSLTLAVILVFMISMLPGTAFAQNQPKLLYADIGGHWAGDAILRWSGLGIIQGSDGMFRPDAPIKRAELAAILNRLMGYPPTLENSFDDTAGKWYEADINALAYQTAYLITRGSAKSAEGDKYLTREEAVYMMSRSFLINAQFGDDVAPFTDIDTVSDRRYGTAITCFQRMGFIGGFPDGSFRPAELFTRAQIVTMLNSIIDIYITQPGVYKNLEGKNILVAAPDVTIQNQDIKYLLCAPKALAGDVILDNCTISNLALWYRYFPRANYDYSTSDVAILTDDEIMISPFELFGGGRGTKSDPFLVETQEHLEAIRNVLTSLGIQYHYLQTTDIALSGEWTAIGEAKNAAEALDFCGTYDGNGHTISGLKAAANPDARFYGLFASVRGTVRNLTVSGTISITATLSDTVKVCNAGAIAAKLNRGKLENCHTDMSIRVENRQLSNIGGLAGLSDGGSVDNCSFGGAISVVTASGTPDTSLQVGGIVGQTKYTSKIRNCRTSGMLYAKLNMFGDINAVSIGGIVGANNLSIIENCYSSAEIHGVGGYYSFVGGIAGLHTAKATAQGSMFSGTVLAEGALMQNNGGGFAGQIYDSAVERCGAAGVVTASGNPGYFNAAGGLAGSMYGSSSATDCYSAGTADIVGTDASIGGLIGRLEGSLVRCYTATQLGDSQTLGGQGMEGLLGTIRGYTIIDSCAVFNVSNPHFIDYEAITAPVSEYKALFEDFGYDFSLVWRMTEGDYNLPILRGDFEETQISILSASPF